MKAALEEDDDDEEESASDPGLRMENEKEEASWKRTLSDNQHRE